MKIIVPKDIKKNNEMKYINDILWMNVYCGVGKAVYNVVDRVISIYGLETRGISNYS